MMYMTIRRIFPRAVISPVFIWTILSSCGSSHNGERPSSVVADSVAAPMEEGWQEVHAQDGGTMKGELRGGKRHGPWTAYYANGMVRSRASYIDGVLDGVTEVFHENGMIYYTGNYHRGKAVGKWFFHDSEGTLIRTALHDSLGRLLEQY